MDAVDYKMVGRELVQMVFEKTELDVDCAASLSLDILAFLSSHVTECPRVFDEMMHGINSTYHADGSDITRIFELCKKIYDFSRRNPSTFSALDSCVLEANLSECLKTILNIPNAYSSYLQAALEKNVDLIASFPSLFNLSLSPNCSVKLLQLLTAMCYIHKYLYVELIAKTNLIRELKYIFTSSEDLYLLECASIFLTGYFASCQIDPCIVMDDLDSIFTKVFIHLRRCVHYDSTFDALIAFLLSGNLIYPYGSDNQIMRCLIESEKSPVLQEVLMLFNREVDPVYNVWESPDKENTVHKFLLDVFSNEGTAKLFYENDLKVLVSDIILRQLKSSELPKLSENLLRILIKAFTNTDILQIDTDLNKMRNFLSSMLDDVKDVQKIKLIEECLLLLNKNLFSF